MRRITANTATTITVAQLWLEGKQPGEGSVYEAINTDTWTQATDVQGDNKNDDGSTNITWNLE